MGLHELLEVAPEEYRDVGVGSCPGLGRPRRILEQGQFAEKFAGFQFGNGARRLAWMADGHLAGEHDVDRLPLFPFVENYLASLVAAIMEEALDDAQLPATEAAKEEYACQAVFCTGVATHETEHDGCQEEEDWRGFYSPRQSVIRNCPSGPLTWRQLPRTPPAARNCRRVAI